MYGPTRSLNWTTGQTMDSFIFTAETIFFSSPKGTLGAVGMPWLLFVPLCHCGGRVMGGRKVARTCILLPNSPTWHIVLSNCF